VFGHETYYEALHRFALTLYDDDFLWEKQEYLEENKEEIEAYKERELEVMYTEFWEEQSPIHRLRQEIDYKVCQRETPERLKGKNTL
jgi:putative two-component system hydrogenase maturation factor HypX/HoxX